MKFILKFEGNTKVVRHRKSESITSQHSNTSFQSNESEIEHTGHSESHSKTLGKKWNGNCYYNTFVWSITQFLKPVFTTSFISTTKTWVIVIARLKTTDIKIALFFFYVMNQQQQKSDKISQACFNIKPDVNETNSNNIFFLLAIHTLFEIDCHLQVVIQLKIDDSFKEIF